MADVPMNMDPVGGTRKRRNSGVLRVLDGVTYSAALSGSLLMVGLLALLVLVIFKGAQPAISEQGWGFLTSSRWNAGKGIYGAAPAIYGTLVTAAIAMVISIPISIGSAIFLVKIAPKVKIPLPNFAKDGSSPIVFVSPRGLVTVVSFLIELLAAIPSIAYGLWGVFFLVPVMQNYVEPFFGKTLGNLPAVGSFFQSGDGGANIMTAGLILAIMVTPIMTAIIRDVLAVAPPELEQGALGLGATWWQATQLVLGHAKMGILGAVILGFARAIGETMAVAMVVGGTYGIGTSVLSSGQTIAGHLASKFREADQESTIHALVYMAFVLLVITTVVNGVARVLVMRATTKKRK